MDEQQLIRALADARRLQLQGQPAESVLIGAPILEDWFVMGPALAGIVTGHPKIAEGDFCITSYLLILDRQNRWARTVNRYYQLGTPGIPAFEP